MANTTVNSTFATPSSKNGWAHLASTNAWNKVAPTSDDGVTNTLLLLALARANSRQANVILANDQITQVYL